MKTPVLILTAPDHYAASAILKSFDVQHKVIELKPKALKKARKSTYKKLSDSEITGVF